MRTRVNHFIGNKLRLLHLNCYSKYCFSICILFSFGFRVDFFCFTQIWPVDRIKGAILGGGQVQALLAVFFSGRLTK